MKTGIFRIVLVFPALAIMPWLCFTEVAPNPTTVPDVPKLSEMPISSVSEVFLDEAPGMGISPSDAEVVGGWLKRVLSHSHRRIDRLSLDRFRKSLRAFDKNSGADFRQRRNESVTLLEFCCDMGWSQPFQSVNSDTLVKQYCELGHQVIAQIDSEIDATLPPDKKDQWKGQVDATSQNVQKTLDDDIKEWSGDFLFPGFKEPLSKSAQADAELLGKTGGGEGLMPRYNVIAKLMQTHDESFRWQLDNFSEYFDAVYGYRLCFHEIVGKLVRNKYWSHYDLSTHGNEPGWPIHIDLLRQITTQPAAEKGK